MKTIVYFLAIIATTSVFGQTKITIVDSMKQMSKSVQNSYTVNIPRANVEEVTKNWIHYLGQGVKPKITLTNGEYKQTAIINTNVSPQPFIIYSTLLQTTDDVRLTAWFTENDVTFLSNTKSPDQHLAIKNMLYDFATGQYKIVLKSELTEEEKKASVLEKDQDKLIKTGERSVKNIQEYNQSILTSQNTISANDIDIVLTDDKISSQKNMVDRTASDPNATKGAKKTLRELEDKKKNLQQANVNSNSNIDEWHKKIREEERNIVENEESQKAKSVSIEKQKLVVEKSRLNLELGQ